MTKKVAKTSGSRYSTEITTPKVKTSGKESEASPKSLPAVTKSVTDKQAAPSTDRGGLERWDISAEEMERWEREAAKAGREFEERLKADYPNGVQDWGGLERWENWE